METMFDSMDWRKGITEEDVQRLSLKHGYPKDEIWVVWFGHLMYRLSKDVATITKDAAIHTTNGELRENTDALAKRYKKAAQDLNKVEDEAAQFLANHPNRERLEKLMSASLMLQVREDPDCEQYINRMDQEDSKDRHTPMIDAWCRPENN